MNKPIDLAEYKKHKKKKRLNSKKRIHYKNNLSNKKEASLYKELSLMNEVNIQKKNIYTNIISLLSMALLFCGIALIIKSNMAQYKEFLSTMFVYTSVFILLYLCYIYRYIGIDLRTNTFNTITLIATSIMLSIKYNIGILSILLLIYLMITVIFMMTIVSEIITCRESL